MKTIDNLDLGINKVLSRQFGTSTKLTATTRIIVLLAAYKRAFIKMPQYQSILPDKATLVNKIDGLNELCLSPTANKGVLTNWCQNVKLI